MTKSILLATLLAAVTAAQARTFYVSTSGKDTNPGTSAKPWRTIQHACSTAASGSTVLVSSGVYKELVTIVRPIQLESAPNAHPIIDGTGIAVPASDAALVLISGVSNVTVQGFEIRNFITTDSNLVPAGILIEGMANNVTIRGNTLDHIENIGTDAASINAFGIAVYGNSGKGAITNLVIDKNVVTATKTGNSETLTLNGNVNGFKVTNNVVHDVDNIGIDCIGFEGTSQIKGQDQARNGYVGLNTVYNVSSLHNPSYAGQESADGIYVDGGTAIVVERNTLYNNDLGMEVTSEHGGHVASSVIVRNNLFYGNNVTGLSIGGYDATRGGTQNCTFVGNTFYENDTTNSGSGEFLIQFHTSGNVFKNNILYASAQGIVTSEDAGAGTPGVAFDYNLYFCPIVDGITWAWGNNTYSDLASMQKASKQDAHSKVGDPEFAAAAPHNFELRKGSAALNAGVILPATIAGTVDFGGNPRFIAHKVDIGCWETSKPGP